MEIEFIVFALLDDTRGSIVVGVKQSFRIRRSLVCVLVHISCN